MQRGLLIWGYLVEAVLAIVLLPVLMHLCKFDIFERMIEGYKTVWFTVVGLLLTISLGVLVAFLTATPNDFGEWLHHIKAFNAYFVAFAAPVAVHLAAIVLIACSSSASRLLSTASYAFLFYALIITLTELNNVRQFYGLLFEFRRKRRQLAQQDA